MCTTQHDNFSPFVYLGFNSKFTHQETCHRSKYKQRCHCMSIGLKQLLFELSSLPNLCSDFI